MELFHYMSITYAISYVFQEYNIPNAQHHLTHNGVLSAFAGYFCVIDFFILKFFIEP